MLCTRSIIRSSGGPALAGRIRTSVAAGIGSGRSGISATTARTAAVEVPCSAPDHPFRLHDTIESGFVDQLPLQPGLLDRPAMPRSEEHTSELPSLMRIPNATF